MQVPAMDRDRGNAGPDPGESIGNVVSMPPSANWTPEQALAHAAQLDWDDVIIIGRQSDGTYSIRSNRMTRERALWLIELGRLDVMGF